MTERIVEKQQNDAFFGIENARKYAKESEKSSKMRFGGFLKRLNNLNINGKYLEIGAGSGVLAAMIAKSNQDIDITAVEISPDMITVANEYLEKENLTSQIRFIEGKITDEMFLEKLGKYDLIYSTLSLHHWEDPQKTITNLMKLLNDKGVLMIFDLRRVWWLYWVPSQSGFYKSIRAAYKKHELEEMLESINIKKYKIESIFPFFLQNVTIRKQLNQK